MRSKKYLSLLSVLLMFCACEQSDGGGGHFVKYFIQMYSEGDIELTMLRSRPNYQGVETVYQTGFVVGLEYPAVEYWAEDGDEGYQKLAERNGDTAFNQWIGHDTPFGAHAFADNFGALHVVSDSDWDDAHPAGTPLDDILLARFYSHAEFIRSGYDTGGVEMEVFLFYNKYFNIVKKLVSELTAADMEMLCWYGFRDFDKTTRSPIIIFTSAPTKAKEHTLTIEWTTVEGKVKTASITCTPEVDPELQL